VLLRVSLLCALVTPLLHACVLLASDRLSVDEPISALSHASLGWLHTVSLLLFAVAHIGLGLAMAGRDHGRLWPYGRALLLISGALLCYVAWYFAVSGPETLEAAGANDPLWVVATLIGFAMGCLQPGLIRQSRSLGHFNAACAVLWILLIPAVLLIGVVSLGVYERTVGLVYVVWIAGVAGGLLVKGQPR